MLMLRLADHLPSDWADSADATDYKTVEIPSSDPTYEKLKNELSGSFNEGIEKIVRVENPFLYGNFLLKKAEYETRNKATILELFHDTGASKIDSILRTNLDRRMANRVKFGQGVSFSPSPQYANQESSRSNGKNRAMIVADVLIGRNYTTYSSDKIPAGDYDTAVGNRRQVYVKFDDNEFYPKYVVYYTSKGRQFKRFW